MAGGNQGEGPSAAAAPLGRSFTRGLRAVALVAALAVLAAPAEGARRAARVFGVEVQIEVLGLSAERAAEALDAALSAVHDAEALTDPRGARLGGVGRLNAGAGGEPVRLEAEVADLLARALAFCRWSGGLHGPLGGLLYGLWGLRQPAGGLPGGPALEQAAAAAACDGLRLDASAASAQLAAGARVELWGFELGFAVDRAAAALHERGAADGRVAVGPVQRGFGSGPSGDGWPASLPDLPGFAALGTLRLEDRSLAVAARGDRLLRIGGEVFAPYLDQRTGRPAEGVVATAAVTELAVDAQALAVAMFVAGSREGRFRAGSLAPPPSILWLLGDGVGEPLLVTHNWSAVTDRR